MNKYAAEQQFTHATISCCRGSGLGAADMNNNSDILSKAMEMSDITSDIMMEL